MYELIDAGKHTGRLFETIAMCQEHIVNAMQYCLYVQ